MRRGAWVMGLVVSTALITGCHEKPPAPTPSPAPDAGPVIPARLPNPPPARPPNPPPPPGSELPRIEMPNPIPGENTLPGTSGWRGGNNVFNGEVEIYASTESAFAGDTVSVKVSTSESSQVNAEILRIGWYNGAGARRVWSGGPYNTDKQAACLRDPRTAMVECHWNDTFQFTVGQDWVSGIYLVKVSRPDRFRSFYTFVVKDHRKAEILYVSSLNTYQAYNAWGGESLYADASKTMPLAKGLQVSFDRPYPGPDGSGKLFWLESATARVLEKYGYDVTYAANLDFVRNKGVLDGIPLMVDSSQDEYWNAEERDQVDAALATGNMSLAFFGANGGYWRTRVLSSSDGRPYRILVCYKNDTAEDPIPGSTVRYRDPPNARPENALFGVMYEGWQLIPFPLAVFRTDHWLFEGTNLQVGDLLPGIVGPEYDRVVNNGQTPPGTEVLLDSPSMTAEGMPGRSQAVVRTINPVTGTIVFSGGTLWWPLGLGADPEIADPRVERMTLNVLEHGLAHKRPMRSYPPASGTATPAPPPLGRWASSVSAYAGVPGPGGKVDGPAATAQFNGPTGLAVNARGQIAVADTNNNAVRLIDVDPARTVTTIAGTGDQGYRDGPGNQAMFRSPTSVAFLPDGSLLVADALNSAIRRIAFDPPAWTVSAYAGLGWSPGFADGAWNVARFYQPTSIAVDGQGNAFVADQYNYRIRMIAAGSRNVSTVAGDGVLGYKDSATGTSAEFSNPAGVAVGSSGEVYVLDSGNQKIRRISPAPGHPVDTIAGRQGWEGSFGFTDGPGDGARLRAQLGITVDDLNQVIFADTANFRIRGVAPGADLSSSSVFSYAGSGRLGSNLGTGGASDIGAPSGLAVAGPGKLVMSDSNLNVIRLITR